MSILGSELNSGDHRREVGDRQKKPISSQPVEQPLTPEDKLRGLSITHTLDKNGMLTFTYQGHQWSDRHFELMEEFLATLNGAVRGVRVVASRLFHYPDVYAKKAAALEAYALQSTETEAA